MPKLLIATTIPETIEAFLLPYVYYFRRNGWQVDGIAHQISANRDCTTAFDQVWDIPWSRRPWSLQNFQRAVPKIREIVAQGKYDLVHVHTPVAAFVTRFAVQPYRTSQRLKVIYTAHGFHFYQGGSVLKNFAFSTVEKLAGAWTDYLVVINKEDELAARQRGIAPPERIVYMPGIGLDLERYSPHQVSAEAIATVRQELGLQPREPLFLAIAELTPRKRPLDILNAFAHLETTNAHLAFAGGGPLEASLQQLTQILNLTQRVHFLGFRSDIPALVRASVATLLVSHQEGLPRSVMESLALEVPVIGSNIRGTRDLLAKGGGLLVEVGNIKAITQAMHWILQHPDEAQTLGQQGRQQMKAYDLSHTLPLHEQLYQQVLGQN